MGILAACLLLTGCAAKHAQTVPIPLNCAKVRITDFTKPCESINDHEMMCDRVRVHIACVGVK